MGHKGDWHEEHEALHQQIWALAPIQAHIRHHGQAQDFKLHHDPLLHIRHHGQAQDFKLHHDPLLHLGIIPQRRFLPSAGREARWSLRWKVTRLSGPLTRAPPMKMAGTMWRWRWRTSHHLRGRRQWPTPHTVVGELGSGATVLLQAEQRTEKAREAVGHGQSGRYLPGVSKRLSRRPSYRCGRVSHGWYR